MTTISNYSHLSATMREDLTGELQPWGDGADRPMVLTFRRQATLEACQSRGLVKQVGQHWQRIAEPTEAGQRARAFLLKAADVPAKVIPWLERAESNGLVAEEAKGSGTIRSWTVRAPEQSADRTQLWLYWGPGKRGGRLSINVYHSHGDHHRNVTMQRARIALEMLADSERNRLHRLKVAEQAMEQVGREVERLDVPNDRDLELCSAARLSTVAHLRHRTDPGLPGWFMVGQVIRIGKLMTWLEVVETHLGTDGRVDWVAVTLNGGWTGRPVIYGEHPQAVGKLAMLEDGPGLEADQLRNWPKNLRAARDAVQLVMQDQCLGGWVSHLADPPAAPPRVLVNAQDNTDPTRHVVLLQRYVPYRCAVRLVSVGMRERFPIIEIRPA